MAWCLELGGKRGARVERGAKRAWCERRGANDGKREKRARPPLADRQAVFLGSWGHVVRAAASRSRGERPLRKRGGVAVWCKASVVQGERGEETSACSACVHCAVGVVVGQGQRPRVALVGVVGVVREGFGAKEARGAKRAGCEESVARR